MPTRSSTKLDLNQLAKRIVDATREILTSNGSVHTRDLVPKLEARGIKVPGTNKTNTVSVILSK